MHVDGVESSAVVDHHIIARRTAVEGLRTFCRTVRRVVRTGEVKDLRSGAEVKASVNSASSQ